MSFSTHLNYTANDYIDRSNQIASGENQFDSLYSEIDYNNISGTRDSNLHSPRTKDTNKQLYAQVSDTASMNSFTTTNDSFNWRGSPDVPQQQQQQHHQQQPYDGNYGHDVYNEDNDNNSYSMPRGSVDANSSKMSSHLLDSSLRDHEDRGTLNSGYIRDSGNMEYMQEDPYSSHRHLPHHDDYYGGGGGDYHDNSYTGGNNMSFERHSEHSLQNDHNRPPNNYYELPNGRGPQGSNSNLYNPAELSQRQPPRSLSPQHDDQAYNYSKHGLRDGEEGGGSEDGRRGGGYAHRESPYHNIDSQHRYDDGDHRYDDGGPDHRYDNGDGGGMRREGDDYYGQNPHQYYDGSVSPPPKPPLSGSRSRDLNEEDSFYQREMEDPHSAHHPDNLYQPADPSSHPYPPDLHGERDDSYAGSYQGDPAHGNYMDPYQPQQYNGEPDQGYPDGIYSQGGGHPSSNYSFQGDPQAAENPVYGGAPPYNDDPQYHDNDNRYPQPDDYREVHNNSRGALDDPYLHDQQQPNHSFHEPYPPQQGYDPYHEDDRYSDIPRSHHSLDHSGNYTRDQQEPLHHPNDSFRNDPANGPEDPHQRKFEGLPTVRQDPFAEDPFHNHPQQLMNESYGRGPSPSGGSHFYHYAHYGLEDDPYSRQSYNDPQVVPYSDQGGSQYDDRVPPYADQGPYYDDQGPLYNDRGEGSPYNDQHGHPYPQGDMPDSYGPLQNQGYPEDYPDNGSNYGSNHPQDLGPRYGADPNYMPEEEVLQRMDQMSLNAPPPPMEGRVTPAGDGNLPSYVAAKHPDLQQVIDFLSSNDDNVKSTAVAYLQHLTFGDDAIKSKTRAMGGIPTLISLLSHGKVVIHKTACGALQNLSYGRSNIENKRAIKNENGVPELIRLLRKTPHEEVMESVTGVLWNLSSCDDLKMTIIEDGMTALMNVVIIKYAGYGSAANPWTTVCRNTTGIIRNVSSAGFEARKQLRESKGLVNTLIHILKQAVNDERNDVDNKPVENTVCILRNLSYRIQEVVDQDFYKRRTLPRQMTQTGTGKNDKGDVGCFGNKSKSKQNRNTLPKVTSSSPPTLPALSIEYRALWGAEIHSIYSALLRRCTNPVTMEAAAGAIQNLTACDWEPAIESRMMMRKEKGLPLMVDLLSAESDRVVCATATALRNLAIDKKNKELIGKYAIRQLASRLPRDNRDNMPDDTVCAIVATLYEVVRDNQAFALSLLAENGLRPLMHINNSDQRYLARTLKFTLTLLKTLWTYKSLHSEYEKLKFYQNDFITSKATPRQAGSRPPDMTNTPVSSNHTTPYNTLSRPISGQGYDDSTLSPMRANQMQQQLNQHQPPSYSRHQPQKPHGNYYGGDPRLTPTPNDGYRDLANTSMQRDEGNYSRGHNPPEEIHMNDFGPGYAPLDEPQPHRTKPPVGGVPLFPTLSPGESSSPYPGDNHEPLYAQVNKGSRRRLDPYSNHGPDGRMSPQHSHHSFDGGSDGGGVDSWV